MATTAEYLSGKAKWARLIQPDMKYKKWSLVLYPNTESYDKLMKLKEMPGGIKNVIKKDEDGYNISISRPTERNYRGQVKGFQPPEVLDGTKKLPDGSYLPLRDAQVGNGSDVTCKIEVYSYKSPVGATEHAIRLASVRVDNLVPYVPKRDFSEDQKKLVAGLEEQPVPLF